MNRDDAVNQFNAFILSLTEERKLSATPETALAIQNKAKSLGLDTLVEVIDGSLHVKFVMPTPVKLMYVTTHTHRTDAKDYHYERLRSWFVAEHGLRLGTFIANRAAHVFKRNKLEGHCYGGCYVMIGTSPASAVAFHKAKESWQYGWVEREFRFIHRVAGFPFWSTKVTVAFAYE